MSSETLKQWTQARRSPFRVEHLDDDETAVVYIYDAISWFAISAADLVPEIAAIDKPKIRVRINSPGGDVFDAVAIYNVLKEHSAQVETRIDGIAASAASFIAQAGDQVVMASHSTMMIHDPWGVTVGDANLHRKQADVLDKLGDNIASIYAERAGGSVREWREAMLTESWYDDQEAVDAGLADEVLKTESAAENRFDLSIYQNVPGHLLQPAATNGHEPDIRAIEQALRDAGLSRKAAKALLADGWEAVDDSARDATESDLLRVLQRMNAA